MPPQILASGKQQPRNHTAMDFKLGHYWGPHPPCPGGPKGIVFCCSPGAHGISDWQALKSTPSKLAISSRDLVLRKQVHRSIGIMGHRYLLEAVAEMGKVCSRLRPKGSKTLTLLTR